MRTLLVVDDEFGITDVLADVLGDEGYRVVVARNGKDGLRRIAEQRPDLVLLDLMMPVMGGDEVLRADPELRDIPVFLMTSVEQSRLPADCAPTKYLRKPFELAVLLDEIQRQLGGPDPH